jgi:hypothetical protein
MALKEGKDSTEFWILKVLTIGAVVLSVLASLGKVPWTPEEVGTYLKGVAKGTTDYVAVFAPYISLLAGAYMWLRTSLKKKELDDEKAENTER